VPVLGDGDDEGVGEREGVGDAEGDCEGDSQGSPTRRPRRGANGLRGDREVEETDGRADGVTASRYLISSRFGKMPSGAPGRAPLWLRTRRKERALTCSDPGSTKAGINNEATKVRTSRRLRLRWQSLMA
jgi:hypothetical protein